MNTLTPTDLPTFIDGIDTEAWRIIQTWAIDMSGKKPLMYVATIDEQGPFQLDRQTIYVTDLQHLELDTYLIGLSMQIDHTWLGKLMAAINKKDGMQAALTIEPFIGQKPCKKPVTWYLINSVTGQVTMVAGEDDAIAQIKAEANVFDEIAITLTGTTAEGLIKTSRYAGMTKLQAWKAGKEPKMGVLLTLEQGDTQIGVAKGKDGKGLHVGGTIVEGTGDITFLEGVKQSGRVAKGMGYVISGGGRLFQVIVTGDNVTSHEIKAKGDTKPQSLLDAVGIATGPALTSGSTLQLAVIHDLGEQGGMRSFAQAQLSYQVQ